MLLSLLVSWSSFAVSENNIPSHSGMSIKVGNFVTPNDNTHYTLLTYSSLQPYTLLLEKPAHEMLKMNFELSVGYAEGNQSGTMVSANMLAQRYFTEPSKGVRLFFEGGIGLIYSKFKIKGQGLYLNFNPQIGFGFDQYDAENRRRFISLRVSHISNGGLDMNNKWIDSVVLSFGQDLSF